MADQLMLTLQAALQQLAQQQTRESLGDRTTYLGASDILACPRKTILAKLQPPAPDLVSLLRFRRGHMAEEMVAAAFTAAGFSNFRRQVEVKFPGDTPIVAHLDFVFVSEQRKTMAVLEVKSPEHIPDGPYGSWESQLYLQMGLLAANFPDYTVEKGAILAVNFGDQGMRLFNGYSRQQVLFDGLIERARSIWQQYRDLADGKAIVLEMEPGPLCGYCPFLGDCPKFFGEEVPELAESVEILLRLQSESKNLESEIAIRKQNLLAIVAERGPCKAHGRILQKVSRSRKGLDAASLSAFLGEHGHSLDEFQSTSVYSFLDIKKAA
jgi:CRISPR-associated exonuclease Cas4